MFHLGFDHVVPDDVPLAQIGPVGEIFTVVPLRARGTDVW